ncbi:DUF4031 domain-containing protein [Pseudoxanthomonas kaohsiungensis]|uniref:DUF4031 domain-containing protein n=1 Tax=Pseudoxanthomonas kaohsiungensis TaxID=283923 RepID=A0ABW3M0Y4_9GAMM|nr:DUF4031 domain-containing protein [Pseudoxanthomonas kaohsiungensis]KAF1702868.1 hypothetical protein CSC66_08835 [Pseudoxanthomonas kaohsiungensis]
MTVYVDEMRSWGWEMHGRKVASCHMFSDSVDLAELHAMAERIGLKRAWFQNKGRAPHYDLVESKRRMAVFCGAQEVDAHQAVEIWRQRREALIAPALAALDEINKQRTM